MNAKTYLLRILPKTISYKFARKWLVKPGNPITLTYSVTAACQSLCKTCQIGKLYRQNPARAREDLILQEIEKIFKGMGNIYFFNISGGEPFLRNDLPEIVELACKYLKPGIVHIPTNALTPGRIEDLTVRTLDIMAKHAPETPLTVKPSIDGIGEIHDEIRGVKGNFKKLEETISRLMELQKKYPSLHVELGTVVSHFNIYHLDEIEDYVHSLGVESYRNEIAEQREEFFNIGDPITPRADQYKILMESFKRKIRENIGSKRSLARVTESFRLVYYDLVSDILTERKQVIPCYAGISNVHLNYNGELWPCCVLGYKKPMGNLRKANYDFKQVFHSHQADEVRRYIREKNCYCPLANQAYSNILCHFPSLFRVASNINFSITAARSRFADRRERSNSLPANVPD
jgi:MoaA/NifB/PqqE/SkfB family radical SAM enzyme